LCNVEGVILHKYKVKFMQQHFGVDPNILNFRKLCSVDLELKYTDTILLLCFNFKHFVQ